MVALNSSSKALCLIFARCCKYADTVGTSILRGKYSKISEKGVPPCIQTTDIIQSEKEIFLLRVKSFAGQVNSIYLYKGGKPSRRGYLAAMERMGTTTENTIFVGDQLFTDVFGANRADMYTILVRPLHPK